MKDLEGLRAKIDEIDSKILGLLEKRWEIAKEIGKIKRKTGIEYYDPEREEKVIEKVKGKTVLDKKFVERIFTGIMEYCRNGEKE